jgi:hypothetical protein
MNNIKGFRWQDKTVTVTLTENELKAIRSAITWAEMLEKSGELELHEYQKEAFSKLKEL